MTPTARRVSAAMALPSRPPPRRAVRLRRAARTRAASEASSEVSIRRRPPVGVTTRHCGPLTFEVDHQDDDARPRNILEEIVWYKNQEIEEMRNQRPVQSLTRLIAKLPPTRDFKRALLDKFDETGRPALIAEVKKASPSKGVIQPDFDPVLIGQRYEKGGASCLSVLTDRKYFQGGFENLKAIFSAGVQCPLLCKEFVIEAYQLFMARAHGADAVLLIAAVLPNKDLQYFMDAAANLGLKCLIEVMVHPRGSRRLSLELLKGVADHLVGINNRSLETFRVDLGTTGRLLSTSVGREMLEKGVLFVGESGIYTSDDVQQMQEAGCKAILVGESLVKDKDQESAVSRLVGESGSSTQ